VSGFGLPETARLARRALEGGPPVALAVVVAASDRALVGRRLAWDGERLHGDLGDEMWTAEATALLRAAGAGSGCHEIGGGVELYVERIEPPADLVIVGAGHIAQPLAGIGKLLGFRVTVLDDRPDFARRARFPDADHVIVADFSEPFAGVPIHDRTHLVLVTRGHRYDYDCLRALAAMGVEPAYIGMIGSRRRVRAAFEQLAQEGFDATWLARVQAPIGLDIGAETPAEIAVAIAAEMILNARGGSGRPLRDVAQVVRYVKSLAAETSALGAGVEPDGAARGSR
jgi:xanthine dehydrogenase accessory factor